MKRLLPFIALCFAALSFTHAQVTSVNAVGMVKISAKANSLTFVSLPFVVEGTTLDDVVGDQLTGAGNSGSSDKIIVWDPDTSTYQEFWKVDGTDTAFDGKWYKDDGQFPPVAADVDIVTGRGFWVQSRSDDDQDLIISGEVPSTPVQVTIPLGLAQIGLPYPVEMSVNSPNFDINQIANGAGNSGSADRLIIWDKDAQSYVFLWLVDGTGQATFDGYWHYDDGAFPPVRATNTLAPGDGFWFQRRNGAATNWTPAKPYVWP